MDKILTQIDENNVKLQTLDHQIDNMKRQMKLKSNNILVLNLEQKVNYLLLIVNKPDLIISKIESDKNWKTDNIEHEVVTAVFHDYVSIYWGNVNIKKMGCTKYRIANEFEQKLFEANNNKKITIYL